MSLTPVVIKKARKPAKIILPAPRRPRLDNGDEPELFTGKVRNMKASMAEERFFAELSRSQSVESWEFRMTIGAPRGLPGWKELDGFVMSRGMGYAIEIDSPFTHRQKKEADRLHDAIVIKELEKMGLQVFPQVIHINGETDLFDKTSTKNTVKRLFG